MKPLFFAVITVVIAGCSSKPEQAETTPAPTLPITSLISETQTTYQDYPASIQGKVNIEIRPQVSGTLDKIFVDEGAFVKAGQAIYKINEQPFRAALNNALASQHATESTLNNARLEVEKLRPLVENNVVSDYQLKSANAAYQVAKANVDQAKANVSTAQINLAYTLIKAPTSGYISRLRKKQGSLVGPNDQEPLTELSDVHEVHVYFALGERDFVSFKNQYPGETLAEKLSKLPEVSLLLPDNSEYSSKGRIDMINGQFDSSTGAITLRAIFPNADGLLRSGNTGKLRLSLQHHDVMIVPQEATVEVQDKVFVYSVGDSNKVSIKPITIICKSGDNYLVRTGVERGEKIILSGFGNLQEGAIINPQPVAVNIAVAKK
ncbi:efflux RND transporter periplasmic adaptor subunit [Pedobacter antarcticus]|uniref:efflux RND transporter periplasmic adaptor subunit n=1 Tax=Pedobacter antarcticus TaxID=34086 RepID=UPI00087FEE49|nr:efflux RND transporter periplasmic adaptor subunit [Pedobacter antarcticus]SDL37727.1 membrane fusion protein, multidrug efflux system [Pedobacter antarcticus]